MSSSYFLGYVLAFGMIFTGLISSNIFFVGIVHGGTSVPASRSLLWAWWLSLVSLGIVYLMPFAFGILIYRWRRGLPLVDGSRDEILLRWTKINLVGSVLIAAIVLGMIFVI